MLLSGSSRLGGWRRNAAPDGALCGHESVLTVASVRPLRLDGSTYWERRERGDGGNISNLLSNTGNYVPVPDVVMLL